MLKNGGPPPSSTGLPIRIERPRRPEGERPPRESGLIEYGLHIVARSAIACIAVL